MTNFVDSFTHQGGHAALDTEAGGMRRKILYMSKTVLPKELSLRFLDAEEYILADRNETDKIMCHLSWLKHCIITWFDEHQERTI
jgi:hypothetical protein